MYRRSSTKYNKTSQRFTRESFVKMYVGRVPMKEGETAQDFLSLIDKADIMYDEYCLAVSDKRTTEFMKDFIHEEY